MCSASFPSFSPSSLLLTDSVPPVLTAHTPLHPVMSGVCEECTCLRGSWGYHYSLHSMAICLAFHKEPPFFLGRLQLVELWNIWILRTVAPPSLPYKHFFSLLHADKWWEVRGCTEASTTERQLVKVLLVSVCTQHDRERGSYSS